MIVARRVAEPGSRIRGLGFGGARCRVQGLGWVRPHCPSNGAIWGFLLVFGRVHAIKDEGANLQVFLTQNPIPKPELNTMQALHITSYATPNPEPSQNARLPVPPPHRPARIHIPVVYTSTILGTLVVCPGV